MKRSIGIFSLCLVLIFTLTESVSAANDDIYVSHILSNVVTIENDGLLIVENYDYSVALSEGFASKKDYSEQEGEYFLKTPKYNFTYYFYQVVYNDGTTITGFDDTVNFSDINNIEEVDYIGFYYSDRGRVRVNRYLDEVSDDNLIVSEDYFGNYPINFKDDFETIVMAAESLVIDTELPGYDFTSSDIDISDAVYYKDDKIVNLIYKKTEVSKSNITISFVHKDGSILEEYTLSGEIGTSFQINDELFTLKDEYDLHDKPEITSTQFIENDQRFTFVYKDIEDVKEESSTESDQSNEKLDDVDTEKIEIENTKKDESTKTPKTSVNDNVSVHLLSIILMASFIYLTAKKRLKI